MKFWLRKLSDLELGYVTCSFEGEGYLGIRRAYSKSTGKPGYQPIANVYNSNRAFLEYLHKITQVGIIGDGRKESGTQKQQYIWRLRNKDMSYLLPLIVPYLVIKQEQAQLILQLLGIPTRSWREPPTLEELELKEYLFHRCQRLNRKGPMHA